MGDTVVRGENSDETLKTPGFVHLRVHSAYSLLEGALPLKKIMSKAGFGCESY